MLHGEHFGHGHLIGGQSARFVGANDGCATQGFHRGQRAHNGVLLGHAASAQCQASGDHCRIFKYIF